MITHAGGRRRGLPDEGVLVVGRGQDADIRVDDKAVSRRHAEFVIEDRRVRLVDLGSRDGPHAACPRR